MFCADVPGLDQREAVRACAVLEPRPPEDGAHRDDRRARRQRRAVGREIVPGRRVEWSDELEAVAEGVVVMQRKPETLDAMAGAVELEGVQRPTGRHGPEGLRGSFDGPRDAVRGVEHGREVSESERVRRELTAGAARHRLPPRALPGRVRAQGAARTAVRGEPFHRPARGDPHREAPLETRGAARHADRSRRGRDARPRGSPRSDPASTTVSAPVTLVSLIVGTSDGSVETRCTSVSPEPVTGTGAGAGSGRRAGAVPRPGRPRRQR